MTNEEKAACWDALKEASYSTLISNNMSTEAINSAKVFIKMMKEIEQIMEKQNEHTD